MAIDRKDIRLGLSVFYQQPHMARPEYGVITSVSDVGGDAGWTLGTENARFIQYVRVRFMGDQHSKSCRPEDLHWPPDYCASDRVNQEGQVFSEP
jgi:hypothetical protein